MLTMSSLATEELLVPVEKSGGGTVEWRVSASGSESKELC